MATASDETPPPPPSGARTSLGTGVVPPCYARIDWATLLRRVYLDDVLSCPCGSRRYVVALFDMNRGTSTTQSSPSSHPSASTRTPRRLLAPATRPTTPPDASRRPPDVRRREAQMRPRVAKQRETKKKRSHSTAPRRRHQRGGRLRDVPSSSYPLHQCTIETHATTRAQLQHKK